MTVTVTSALAGPATARYSNVYGALVDLGVLSGLGAQDVTGSGDPVAPILNASQFYAPLTHSLVLTRGTGNPTYTRATNAWEFDNEGKLILVPSGAARFGGARMVRNLLAATATLSTQNVTTVATRYTLSFYGTGSVTLSGTATGTLNGTGASNRVQTTVTATAGTLTLTVSGSVTAAQLENVSGQSDQTASEYVSVGVLSAPYHGAGVDGVKYFETNKDGSAISASSLLGYHAEGARTNSLINSRILTNRDIDTSNRWTSIFGIGAEVIGNGTFADATGWTLGTGITVSGGVLNINNTSGSTQYADYGVPGDYITGKEYIIEFDYTYNSGDPLSQYVKGALSTSPGAISGTKKITVTAGQSAFTGLRFYVPNTCNCTIDNLSIKEACIQSSTCTGIDNVPNSASTITAGAADATILQTLTIAAAARSSSAYVKRRTGTGNVYFTRDGGTTWTNITASVGASWTRVKIENTSVLNPSIGFKLATSGDAIDVDCVQDEAGAYITSPIITTNASVTRNVDVLTYPPASNWSDTAGWALASVYKPDWSYVAGGVIGSATNGLLPLTTNTGAKAYDGTNTVNGPVGSPSGTVKMALSWGSGALQVAANGTAGTAGSYDGAWGLATIGINTSAASMYAKNAYIAQSALTAAQLAQVTA